MSETRYPSDEQVEAALDAVVADGESVRFYLEACAFKDDDETTRRIMTREVIRVVLASQPQPSTEASERCGDCPLKGQHTVECPWENLGRCTTAHPPTVAETPAAPQAEPVAHVHKFRKIGGGGRYEQANLAHGSYGGDHRDAPDPEPGYEWCGSYPLYAAPHPEQPAQHQGEPSESTLPERRAAILAVESFISNYVDDYEFAGDSGSYSPNQTERDLIRDAIFGVLADDEFIETFVNWRALCKAAKQGGEG